MKFPNEGHVLVTPEIAREWLTQFNYRHQRRIRSYHVSNLASEIKAGRFRVKTQITFCRFKGKEGTFVLTNGQHTLSAIIQANKGVLLDVIVTDVQTEEQVADDYARHDTHLTRQLVDSLVAHDLHTELGVTLTQLNWISAAAIYLEKLKGNLAARAAYMVSHDVKLGLTRKYGESCVHCLAIIEVGKTKPYLTRKTTLACMIAAYEKEPGVCEEFFGAMAKDDGLRLGDPRKTLLEFFKESKAGGSDTNMRNVKRNVADHEFIKAIALAWNAYIDRKELKSIRITFDERKVEFKRVGTFAV